MSNVTIVVPVHNREGYLQHVLKAIPEEYPLIVVDNASTDASLAVAQQICQTRAHAIVTTEAEPGAAAARNRGLALCKTPWVYFFDSDDDFTGLPHIGNDKAEYDMVCIPTRMVVDGKERIRDYRPTSSIPVQILTAMLSTQAMIFRTDWLRAIGGWDNRCRVWDDWELGIRSLLHQPRLKWDTQVAYHHIYVHADSITGTSYSERAEGIAQCMRIAYDNITAARNEQALKALDLRCSIVCGTLRKEGNPKAARNMRQLIKRPTLFGTILEWYTALGGRGAWRIALLAHK